MIFFFFQAEDGIRDIGVTGVQTCALPISITLSCNLSSSLSSFSLSLSTNFVTGIPVHLDIISAISSSVTSCFNKLTSSLVSIFSSILFNSSSSLGRSEEHTSELQSRQYLVCRLLLEKKNK